MADLTHFLGLPEHTPGSARRLAEHLAGIVRAATAGDTGSTWTSSLHCRRRPGNRACPGRLMILRPEPPGPIHWQCSACQDEGVISNWQDSSYDLRSRRFTLASAGHEVVIPDHVAATLRDVQVLDPDAERLVFRIRAHHPDGAVLTATGDELDELIGFVAAEANHEPQRRRQRRLDDACDALNEALASMED